MFQFCSDLSAMGSSRHLSYVSTPIAPLNVNVPVAKRSISQPSSLSSLGRFSTLNIQIKTILIDLIELNEEY